MWGRYIETRDKYIENECTYGLTFDSSAIPGYVRFRQLKVSPSDSVEVLNYLVRNRHAFHGAVLHIDTFRPGTSTMVPTNAASFWHLLEQLEDGHCYDQSNSDSQRSSSKATPAPSSSSPVWFRELRLWLGQFGQTLLCDYFLGLPFVRRQSVVRIACFGSVESCESAIIDWLFDDTDYYANNCDSGTIDGHGHLQRRCFGHRHLAIYMNRLNVSNEDLFPLLNDILDKVSRQSRCFWWEGRGFEEE